MKGGSFMDEQQRNQMASNSKECNDSIKCDVVNCTYHNESDHCTAKKIHVGPQFAVSNQDTVCATFKTE